MVTVENKGKSGKGWWWYLDQTADQVKDLINQHKLRITDLNAYEIGGKTRFSFVVLSATRVKTRARGGWRVGVSAAALKKEVNAKGARLIDIERQLNGAYAGVAVKDPGFYDVWRSAAASPAEVGRPAVNEGSRSSSLETAPGGYAAPLGRQHELRDRAHPPDHQQFALQPARPWRAPTPSPSTAGRRRPSPRTFRDQPMSVMKPPSFAYVSTSTTRAGSPPTAAASRPTSTR